MRLWLLLAVTLPRFSRLLIGDLEFTFFKGSTTSFSPTNRLPITTVSYSISRIISTMNADSFSTMQIVIRQIK